MTSNTPSSATSDLEALLGMRLADRYVLQRQVGSGSTTAIFEAADTKTDRVVTFKLIRPRLAAVPEFAAGFDAEIRGAAELRHPNIAAIYDWGYTEVADTRSAFVVTERLTAGSLRDLVDRGRRLSPSQALSVGLDACKALDHAHRRGNVHTELTPAKILFGDDRRLRIVDFGLSRLIGGLMWLDPSNVPNHVAWYAAPEQALGESVTGRTDVYALGMILTEAMTGDVPFKDASTTATLNNRVGKLLPVSADMGPLASVLEHAARPDPEDRFSAAGFGKNLVHTATRLPRPEPLPLLSSGLFETAPDRLREPSDPTGGVTRPSVDAKRAETDRRQSALDAERAAMGLAVGEENAKSGSGAVTNGTGNVGEVGGRADIKTDDDTFDGSAEFDDAAVALVPVEHDQSERHDDSDGGPRDDRYSDDRVHEERDDRLEARDEYDDDEYESDEHEGERAYDRAGRDTGDRGDLTGTDEYDDYDGRDDFDDYEDDADDDYAYADYVEAGIAANEDYADDDDLDDAILDDAGPRRVERDDAAATVFEQIEVTEFDDTGGVEQLTLEQAIEPPTVGGVWEVDASDGDDDDDHDDDDHDDERDHGDDDFDDDGLAHDDRDDSAGSDTDHDAAAQVGVIDLSGIDMSRSSDPVDDLATGVVPVLGVDEDDGLPTGVLPVTRVEADSTGRVVRADTPASVSGSASGTSRVDDSGYADFEAADPGYGQLDYGDFGTGDLGAAPATVGAPPAAVGYEGLEPDRERRRRFPVKTMLGLLVIIGLVAVAIFAFQLLSTKRYVVPNLVGRPIDEAQLQIAPNGWDVSVARERSDDQPQAGLIIRTSPPAGDEVAEGEPFEMVVSDGPVQRELPDLSGIEASEAQARLVSLGMVVTVEKANDESVPAGFVIRWYVPDQDLQPGAMVDPGTDVILVVSDGPAPREMPNLIGMPVEQARAGLAELGLTLAIDAEQPDANVPAGAVSAQSSQPGTMVPRDSEIRVVVSTGRADLEFPDLSGAQGFEAAKKVLEDAGFKVVWQLGDQNSTNLKFFVGDVEPKAGDIFPVGTEVAVESR